MSVLATADEALGRLVRIEQRRSQVVSIVVPMAAVLAALSVGGVLMAVDGVAPLSVYGEVFRGVFVLDRGLADTAVQATPFVLLGLGLAVAYQARVVTIGAEGQYVVGAVVAVAWATADGVRELPGPVLVVSSVLVAAACGAVWAAVTGLLLARFGTSVVITGLLLNYVALALLAWAVRVGIKDPKAFTPQSRVIGDAALPIVPGLEVHLGFLLALVAVPVVALALARSRAGYRVAVLGDNADALSANETAVARTTLLVLVVCGALAGLAGYVQVAGVTTRLNPAFATGYGYTAIVVALLGRLRPIGVLVAGLGLSALTIGFDAAERTYEIQSSTVGVIQALIIVFFVAGDALAERWSNGRP
jgi:simple sugar transport system permease protein